MSAAAQAADTDQNERRCTKEPKGLEHAATLLEGEGLQPTRERKRHFDRRVADAIRCNEKVSGWTGDPYVIDRDDDGRHFLKRN